MNIVLAELVSPNVNLWGDLIPETIVAVTGIIVMLYDCFAPLSVT
jgi:hypothetical protein